MRVALASGVCASAAAWGFGKRKSEDAPGTRASAAAWGFGRRKSEDTTNTRASAGAWGFGRQTDEDAPRISVRAPWQRYCSQDVLEAAEHVAAHGGPAAFWRYALGGDADADAGVLALAGGMHAMAARLEMHAAHPAAVRKRCRAYAAIASGSTDNGDAPRTYTCDASKIVRALERNEGHTGAEGLPFGHARILGTGGPAVVLYGAVRTPELAAFVRALEEGRANCVLVFRHDLSCVAAKGVSLDAVAGVDLELREAAPGSTRVSGDHGRFVLSHAVPEDCADLGTQAIGAVVSASNPLAALSFVAENAPLAAADLATRPALARVARDNAALFDELHRQWGPQHVSMGQRHGDVSVPTRASLNGLELAPGADVPSLVALVAALDGAARAAGVSPRDARAIAASRAVIPQPRLDVGGLRGAVVLCDLEADGAYAAWPRSYAALLAPPAGGPFHAVARNVGRLLLVYDATPGSPGHGASSAVLAALLQMLDQRIPLQLAVLPVDRGDSDPRVAEETLNFVRNGGTDGGRVSFARLVSCTAAVLGREVAVRMLRARAPDAPATLALPEAQSVLDAASPDALSKDALQRVLGDSAYDDAVETVHDLGLHQALPALLLNGRLVSPRAVGNWQRAVAALYAEDAAAMRAAIARGDLRDEHDAQAEVLLRGAHVVRHRHPVLFAPETLAPPAVEPPRHWLGPPGADVAVVLYAAPARDAAVIEAVLAYAAEALASDDGGCGVRLALHPVVGNRASRHDVAALLVATGEAGGDASAARSLFAAIRGDMTDIRHNEGGESRHNEGGESRHNDGNNSQYGAENNIRYDTDNDIRYDEGNNSHYDTDNDIRYNEQQNGHYDTETRSLKQSLRDAAGTHRMTAPREVAAGAFVSINGRMHGPITSSPSGRNLTPLDVASAVHHTCVAHVQRVRRASGGTHTRSGVAYDAALEHVVRAFTPLVLTGATASAVPVPERNAATVVESGSAARALVHVDALVCPFSAAAARISAALLALGGAASARIVLVAAPHYKEVPRAHVLHRHRHRGSLAPLPPGTRVAVMPAFPATWAVRTATEADVDNYTARAADVLAWDLVALRAEGRVVTAGNAALPATAEVHVLGALGSVARSPLMHTHAGPYFQLGPLQPGVHALALFGDPMGAHDGPLSDVAGDATHADTAQNHAVTAQNHVVADVLGGRVHRVLAASNGPRLVGYTHRGSALSLAQETETVHVFTVASGHTYERLARVMIASVVESTAAHVHLWLAGPPSPQMRRALDALAGDGRVRPFRWSEVGVAWPAWLNTQSRRHRRAWAAKVLFLDALFPAHVRRVVYIDADQVVRGDVAALAATDMAGAPYGMVPFCAGDRARDETRALRFWEHGYWDARLGSGAAHYHISALILVDIGALRARGDGDTLRMHYEALSRDPASLANLDQDLPNALQPAVPIFALPADWLWCETWCADGVHKDAALAIDLCSNPLRPEDKLAAAHRVIPEFAHLDALVSAIIAEPSPRSSQASLSHSEL